MKILSADVIKSFKKCYTHIYIMVHKINGLFYGKNGASAHNIEIIKNVKNIPFSIKKQIYAKMPIAEKAYEVAKGEDKKGAFLAANIMAVPIKKRGEFVAFLSRHNRNAQKIASEVATLEMLDNFDITDIGELKIYEQKIMKNEISVATLIAKITALTAGEQLEPTRLIYVYSPIGACIDHDIGMELREKAIRQLYGNTLHKVQNMLVEKQSAIMEAKKVVDTVIRTITSNGGDCRIKNPFSATLKLEAKGHINDIAANRIVVENAQKAINVAEQIVKFLKGKKVELTVDDYYRKPKKNDYRACHINFITAGVPSEIQVTDETARQRTKKFAPHSLYKSYGVLSTGLSAKLSNYL